LFSRRNSRNSIVISRKIIKEYALRRNRNRDMSGMGLDRFECGKCRVEVKKFGLVLFDRGRGRLEVEGVGRAGNTESLSGLELVD
jgi:hypothetical protein